MPPCDIEKPFQCNTTRLEEKIDKLSDSVNDLKVELAEIKAKSFTQKDASTIKEELAGMKGRIYAGASIIAVVFSILGAFVSEWVKK